MKLYFAGPLTSPSQLQEHNCKVLISYVDLLNKANRQNFNKYQFPEVFLDSGAFSVFTGAAKINLDDYISFIKKHESKFVLYAALDVISDPVKTFDNYKIMLEAGLKPLPTFHYGEDLEWLKKYLDITDYIGLGGMAADGVKRNKTLLKAFLVQVFQLIPRGYKLHGFGLTSNLLTQFPFYSVDSTAWLSAAKHRSVTLFKDGRLHTAESLNKKKSKLNCENLLVTNKSAEHLQSISIKSLKQFEDFAQTIGQRKAYHGKQIKRFTFKN